MAIPPALPIEIKPIVRVRVRCADAVPDPWLRRLYVVWAPPSSVCDPSETSIEFGPDVSFSVAQTDEKGYICPLRNALDPAPEATLPLFPGLDYYFFFVRHPDSSLAEQLCLDMNADPYPTVERVGQPQFLQAVLTETGKDEAADPGRGDFHRHGAEEVRATRQPTVRRLGAIPEHAGHRLEPKRWRHSM